jgi:hypothetical protein
VAELVYACDSKSHAARLEGSSPSSGTSIIYFFKTMLFNKKNTKTTNFYCFSPPVMMATIIIELCLAVYVLARRHLTKLQKLVGASLIFLAAFQIAEYCVCRNIGDPFFWSRAGFVFISTLPPLGLHIMYTLAKKKEDNIVRAAYASLLVCVAFFVVYADAFSGQQCTGNYVIFHLADGFNIVYGAYYYGWLLVALNLGNNWRKEFMTSSPVRTSAIQWLMMGYGVFLIPTALVCVFDPLAVRAIPSIMCGFAVIFAIILVTKIIIPFQKAKKL